MQVAALLAVLHHFSRICRADTSSTGGDESDDIHAFTWDNLWPHAVVPYRYVLAVCCYCSHLRQFRRVLCTMDVGCEGGLACFCRPGGVHMHTLCACRRYGVVCGARTHCTDTYTGARVLIVNGHDCSSQLGRRGGVQQLSLPYWCHQRSSGRRTHTHCTQRTGVLHELLHLLGFGHEHTRADRSKHILVNWPNIASKYKYTFQVSARVYTHRQRHRLTPTHTTCSAIRYHTITTASCTTASTT